ncbi:uncharacterized protein LY79DRAFT_42200 [Colletotrichum navitas]|uniref:Uncharacterized protein n=1 Tax=Colletotrichum navitas TaxID=681940 RepID=A0AAD8PMK7_9PEZI|nr:uncharacterized protein LY79DRAFT_42200 [Colletotrichum navitas]KAK1572831.1 hypothetical protein LY79DRAFT_42200 [Colletotrichum navitas]
MTGRPDQPRNGLPVLDEGGKRGGGERAHTSGSDLVQARIRPSRSFRIAIKGASESHCSGLTEHAYWTAPCRRGRLRPGLSKHVLWRSDEFINGVMYVENTCTLERHPGSPRLASPCLALAFCTLCQLSIWLLLAFCCGSGKQYRRRLRGHFCRVSMRVPWWDGNLPRGLPYGSYDNPPFRGRQPR